MPRQDGALVIGRDTAHTKVAASEPDATMPYLYFNSGGKKADGTGKVHLRPPSTAGEWTEIAVGRGNAGNELVIRSAVLPHLVSKRHAIIRFNGHSLSIEDLASSTGGLFGCHYTGGLCDALIS